ncbi:hypothetical protein CH275_21995 [Rhodococcus sp. 06-235-1A]|nr:hypothetical protein CH275_21995 [Rhodococcus sp. 06-235-1A]
MDDFHRISVHNVEFEQRNFGQFTQSNDAHGNVPKIEFISHPCRGAEDDDGERPPWPLVHLESWVTR